jgi:hypothetical protein
MANATQLTLAAQIGGTPGQHLVACNRCNAKGIWVGPRSSGTCFACRGTGLLDRDRAERYLSGHKDTAPAHSDPFDEAMALAAKAKSDAEAMGWIMQEPVALPGRVELLGRNPKRPGKTVHLTWVLTHRTRYQEWLDGSPSQHKDLLKP